MAICEQVEDPRQAKGLVKREVTRVVTPGTLTDDALLDPRESNYLAAVVSDRNGRAASNGPVQAKGSPSLVGLAWVELSTGRFHAAVFPPLDAGRSTGADRPGRMLGRRASRRSPCSAAKRLLGSETRPDVGVFAGDAPREALAKHFGTATLEGFGFDDERDALALRAAGAILDYLTETQKIVAGASRSACCRITRGTTLEIDESTRRSLEIYAHAARRPPRRHRCWPCSIAR